MRTSYVIALGSNQRHPRYGRPADIIARAVARLAHGNAVVLAASTIIKSRPIGPAQRDFSNAAVLIETATAPRALLSQLKVIEAEFGRKAKGQRWRARIIDLDIILWSGGFWSDAVLTIPHPAFRERGFVVGPANAVAARWRDPISQLSLRQMRVRLDRKRRCL